MAVPQLDYYPPPTVREFIRDFRPGELFYDWIVGPVGSGKTTGLFFKLVRMAKLQAKGPDGIRRTRAVVVRNTAPQLKDTTIVSWNYWFKDGQAGKWHATEKNFDLRFGDVECEVLFRPLDTADDVARVLSLEVTFALVDEFTQIPKPIIDALSVRCGRYPPKKDGGATNWGMWGSSNPSTEDNWWYDHLHHDKSVYRFVLNEDPVQKQARDLLVDFEGVNAKYFLQPSGLTADAENLENLPGNEKYYVNQCKGKSDVWIKQFVEAEWGFSIAGKPVISCFKPVHVARSLHYNPDLPLVGGFDPGLAGSAMVFGQQDYDGTLIILGELVQSNIGTRRFISERLKPYLRRRFPLSQLIVAPDPAARNRTQTDEKTVVDILRQSFEVDDREANNRLPLRINAIDYFCTTMTETGYSLKIDAEHCPQAIRALKGGWRWTVDPKKNMITGIVPEKNNYSHPGDAVGYLARYFHRQTERELRFSGSGGRFTPPRTFGPRYNQV